MSPRLKIGTVLVSALAVVGCFSADEGEPAATSGEALTPVACADVAGTDVSRSLAVTDPAALAKFSFTRVMNQLRTSAGVATTDTSAAVWRRWMKTFGASPAAGDCDDPSIDPNDYGLVCPRPHELELAAVNPFAVSSAVKLVPVALFNRFDLAPANGAHCGEYRVVYAMTSTSATLSGRAFIIFEAALPNPEPAKGIEACLPVARFWQGLTKESDPQVRAAKLDRFYFGGTAVAGFEPVVTAGHYGLATNGGVHGSGQIRTNFFIDGAEWHLREFKTERQCTNADDPATCLLTLDHVPVKGNPAEELFAGTHAKSAAFRTAFVNQVPALVAADPARIGMSTANGFNEFESVSQRGDVLYRSSANAQIRSDIAAKLVTIGSKLTPDNVLDRATTQTCAGCHQVANGLPLGGGKTWPSSLGFVHVDERSALSPALTGTFLPRRKATLEKFINDRCTGPAPDGGSGGVDAGPPILKDGGSGSADAGGPVPVDEPTTIGGSAEGSPN